MEDTLTQERHSEFGKRSDRMVELVARVISTKLYGGYPVGEISNPSIKAQWGCTKDIARAVIEAIQPDIDLLERAAFERGWKLVERTQTRGLD
ncbi:hypothetical protein R1538_34550 [Rhizobium leguminosarum]|uniref:hypothetical protein n=1 Tax=Rhizobium leguminosarum TaxID=384 RepID=UPI00293DE885|nr:hypothetical protein [Rhizobium leguminosarum]MDV4166172.1 hypothetical protein [Rhizobium leguminosarum]